MTTSPMEPIRTSEEHVQDACFEGLIRRWTERREWEWVAAANLIYGHVLEERDRLDSAIAEVRRIDDILDGLDPDVVEVDLTDYEEGKPEQMPPGDDPRAGHEIRPLI